MNPRLSPIRLTIIDFLGVFFPGIIWIILLLTAWRATDPNVDPLVILHQLTSNSASRDPAFYVALFLSSLLLGYLIKAMSSRPIEFLSYPWALLSKKSRAKHWFPYTGSISRKKPRLFHEVETLFNDELKMPWENLVGYQPFEACKELIKLHTPALLGDIQEREAQVRMLGSLFLASFFSLVLSLVPNERPLGWTLISLATTLILGTMFRRRRRREVEDVYMITVIARQIISAGIQEASTDRRKAHNLVVALEKFIEGLWVKRQGRDNA